MKEIEPLKKDEVKLHAQKQIEKKKVFLGSEVLQRGHRCFEINETTLAVVEAEYEKQVHFNSADTRTIVTKPDCVYINALNAKNALKVYNKGGRNLTAPLFNSLNYFDHA